MEESMKSMLKTAWSWCVLVFWVATALAAQTYLIQVGWNHVLPHAVPGVKEISFYQAFWVFFVFDLLRESWAANAAKTWGLSEDKTDEK